MYKGDKEMTYDVYEVMKMKDDISSLRNIIDELKAEIHTPKREILDADIFNAIQPAVAAANQYEIDISGAALNEVDRHSICSFFKNIKYIDKRLYDIYVDRLPAICLAALLTKAQMKAQIEGEHPGINSVAGPMLLNSFHLGISNHWRECSIFIEGENDFVHSGTDLLQGYLSKPIIFGNDYVGVLFGVALQKKTAITSMQIAIDGKEKTPLVFDSLMNLSNYQVKSFEKSFLLKKDTTLHIKLYSERDTFLDENDYPTLLGISFIREYAYRNINPKVYPTNGTVRTYDNGEEEFEYNIHL